MAGAAVAAAVLGSASVAAGATPGNGNGPASAPGLVKKVLPVPVPVPVPLAVPPITPPGQARTGGAAPGAQGGKGTATAAPATDPTAPAGAPAIPVAPPTAPVLGRSMAVAPVDGAVNVRLPGSSAFVALDDAGSIPSGAVVDARGGTLELSSALDAAGRTQTARVRGALFEIRQSRNGHGVTDLVMRSRAVGCAAPRAGVVRAASVAPAKARGKRGALWASDDHGRFRTRGRNSVATVRGTRWSTRETCAGTLTRVMQGAVAVRDLVRHRTVIVRAGHAYLARSAR